MIQDDIYIFLIKENEYTVQILLEGGGLSVRSEKEASDRRKYYHPSWKKAVK